MATLEKDSFDQILERQWIKRSLEFQQAGLVRALRREMPGSDIYRMRQKEIELLESIIRKY